MGPAFEREENKIEGPVAEFNSSKTVPVALLPGEFPAVSDILWCNQRILYDFDYSGDDKLHCFISKLGVVYGDSKRDVEKKCDDL